MSFTKRGLLNSEKHEKDCEGKIQEHRHRQGVLQKDDKDVLHLPADDNLSIYLCFGEYEKGNKVSYKILSVTLRELFPGSGASSSSSSRKFKMVTVHSGDGLARYMGCCQSDSKIFLGGGAKPAYRHQRDAKLKVLGTFTHGEVRKIYFFDTKTQGGLEALPKKMLKGKIQPFLVMLGGTLYALGRVSRTFEMFDGNDWCELPPPPHADYWYYPFTYPQPPGVDFNISYAVAGPNILVSDRQATYRFNTDEPDLGWRKLESSVKFRGTSLVVDDGTQYVLFTFKLSKGYHISVHLISYQFDVFKMDYGRVELPEYLMEYKDDHLGELPLTNYGLLQLQAGVVCLVVSELVDDEKKLIRRAQFVAFSFKVRPMEPFKTIFLPRTPMVIHEEVTCGASPVGQMLGAFLLKDSQVQEDISAEQ